MPSRLNKKEGRLKTVDIAIFAMLGAVMYTSKLLMEVLPNVHLLGMFIVASTVVYRAKALYPIYIYVFLNGLFAGFNAWWIPYLYIWAVLWGMTMLIPKKLPEKAKVFVYSGVSSLHGFLFGTLYAPAQAIMFGYDLKTTIAWIISGLSFDFIHGVSNFICGFLIIPMIKILESAKRIGN